MTIVLSAQDSARWVEGGWSGYFVEQTVIEDLDRRGVDEPVVVVLPSGDVAFWIPAPGVKI